MNGTGAPKGKPTDTPQRATPHCPEAQRWRIMQSYISGISGREIARREHVDRKTVARIIASPEMRELQEELVRETRACLLGLIKEAQNALRYDLRKRKDGRIALQFLSLVGLFREDQASVVVHPPRPISQEGRRIAEVVSKKVQAPISPASLMLSEAIAQKCEIFSLELPEALRDSDANGTNHETAPQRAKGNTAHTRGASKTK